MSNLIRRKSLISEKTRFVQKSPRNFHAMHLKALEAASKAIRESREMKKSPMAKSSRTIYEVLKENKEKTKHLDPIDLKRKCPHPMTGFFCQLCACEKVPKEVVANAVNYGKSPKDDNTGLKTLRDAYKFRSSPKSPCN